MYCVLCIERRTCCIRRLEQLPPSGDEARISEEPERDEGEEGGCDGHLFRVQRPQLSALAGEDGLDAPLPPAGTQDAAAAALAPAAAAAAAAVEDQKVKLQPAPDDKQQDDDLFRNEVVDIVNCSA